MKKLLISLILFFTLTTTLWAGIEFDGVDDVVDCGIGLDNVSALTVSFWAKLGGDDTSGQTIITKNTSGEDGWWRVRLTDLGGNSWRLYFAVDYATTNLSHGWEGSITDTTNWHHYAVTWDGSATGVKAIMYVDGIPTGAYYDQDGVGGRVSDTGKKLLIGSSDGSNYFDGQLESIAVYEAVLTASQIAKLSNVMLGDRPLSIGTPVAYWRMNDGSIGTSADGDAVADTAAANEGTGSDGANNTGLSWIAEPITSHAATTYYVRTGGGTPTQCLGTTNADYDGAGSGEACAFSHPLYASPVAGSRRSLQPGDTLSIASGSYKLSPAAVDSTNYATPFRIIDGITVTGDHSSPPQLWGAAGLWETVAMIGADSSTFQDFEITDQEACTYDTDANATYVCTGSTETDLWAHYGLALSGDNLTLKNLNIHGMGTTGIEFTGVGGTSNFTNVKVNGNAHAGMHGYNSTDAILNFYDCSVSWNGCVENYPYNGTVLYCGNEGNGMYGDGVGLTGGGGDYRFYGGEFMHNTCDAIDIIYNTQEDAASTHVFSGLRVEGNAGTGIKTDGASVIVENNIILENCSFFDGKSYEATEGAGFSHCRAGAKALSFEPVLGFNVYIYGNTIYTEEANMITTGTGNCDGTEVVYSRNNIFYGETGQDPHLYYNAALSGNSCTNLNNPPEFNDNYSIGKTLNDYNDMGANSIKGANPQLAVDPNSYYDVTIWDCSLGVGSTAIGSADLTVTGITLPAGFNINHNDYFGRPRGVDSRDMGAVESSYKKTNLNIDKIQ